MRKPTLEEVKEYFKNAVTVIPVEETEVVDITKNIVKKIHEWHGYYWIDISNYKGESVLLWDKYEGYSKILSYKTPRFEITKEQILELEANGNHKTMLRCREWFPSVFEIELTAGKWYKGHVDFDSLICITGLEKDSNSEREYTQIGYYGFASGTYKYKSKIANYDHEQSLVEATESEVFEALKNEAKKMGFKDGDYIKRRFDIGLRDAIIDNNKYPYDDEYHFDAKEKFLEYLGFVIFSKGLWAERFDTITKEEAERQLNAKII